MLYVHNSTQLYVLNDSPILQKALAALDLRPKGLTMPMIPIITWLTRPLMTQVPSPVCQSQRRNLNIQGTACQNLKRLLERNCLLTFVFRYPWLS